MRPADVARTIFLLLISTTLMAQPRWYWTPGSTPRSAGIEVLFNDLANNTTVTVTVTALLKDGTPATSTQQLQTDAWGYAGTTLLFPRRFALSVYSVTTVRVVIARRIYLFHNPHPQIPYMLGGSVRY